MPPVRVAISGCAGQIGYSLLPMIAKGDMFGYDRRVIIQGLDLNLQATKDTMRAIEMELQDGNFPLLTRITLTTSDEVAFKDADCAILLGAFPKQDGREEREIVEKNVTIFRTMGKALEKYASRKCKVLVVGNPANTNAYICAHYAEKLPKENFFGFACLDHNRATGQIAARLGVSTSDVRNVIVWGTPKGPCDFDNATVKGSSIMKALTKAEDKEWLKSDVQGIVHQRGAEIVKLRKSSAAMSGSRGVVDQVHALFHGTRPGEYVSMGVWSKGNPYGVSEDIYFSFPVQCMGKARYRIVSGLNINQKVQKDLKQVEAELVKEQQVAKDVFKKHDQPRAASVR